jgi:hypothetical protein
MGPKKDKPTTTTKATDAEQTKDEKEWFVPPGGRVVDKGPTNHRDETFSLPEKLRGMQPLEGACAMNVTNGQCTVSKEEVKRICTKGGVMDSICLTLMQAGEAHGRIWDKTNEQMDDMIDEHKCLFQSRVWLASQNPWTIRKKLEATWKAEADAKKKEEESKKKKEEEAPKSDETTEETVMSVAFPLDELD